MRVLLVNPPFDREAEVPPLGLLCLGSVLIREGVEVAMLDLDAPGAGCASRDLQEALAAFAPELLGVSATSRNVDAALAVSREAKAFDPAIRTVLGGVHATVAAEGLLEAAPELDFIVRGAGEDALRDLARQVERRGGFDGIAGLSFRAGGRAIHNPESPGAVNLDSYPMPAYHLVENSRYEARSISSSRGCFHGCSFCSIRAMYGRQVSYRAIQAVADEVMALAASGAKRIMFTDDNFTSDPRRLKALCATAALRGLAGRVEFISECRLDDIARNPISAQALGEAGFRYVYAGAESGSRQVLDYYRKGTTPEEIFDGAMHCLANNVMPVVNFIMFGPRDTASTIRETISFARRLFESGADISYTETLVPYPGTPIKKQLEEEGRFRSRHGAPYFEPAGDIGYEQFLAVFSAARARALEEHGSKPAFELQRVYHELGCLDELLRKGDFCKGNKPRRGLAK